MSQDNIDQIRERVRVAAEEPVTQGRWCFATDENPDGTLETVLFAADAQQELEHGNPVDVRRDQVIARFARVADARLVIAAVNQMAGIPTDLIETLPHPVADMVVSLLALKTMLAKVNEAADSDEKWAALRQGIIETKAAMAAAPVH